MMISSAPLLRSVHNSTTPKIALLSLCTAPQKAGKKQCVVYHAMRQCLDRAAASEDAKQGPRHEAVPCSARVDHLCRQRCHLLNLQPASVSAAATFSHIENCPSIAQTIQKIRCVSAYCRPTGICNCALYLHHFAMNKEDVLNGMDDFAVQGQIVSCSAGSSLLSGEHLNCFSRDPCPYHILHH
jgi:hypothetical protein